MIREIYELVSERLNAARQAPLSACQRCAVEELEEILAIIEEVCWLEGEALNDERI